MYKKIHARVGGKEEDHLKIIDTLHFILAAGESYILSKRQADGSPIEAPPGLVVLEEGVAEEVYQNGRINTFNAIHDTLIIELNEFVQAKAAGRPSPHPELDTIDSIFTSVVDGKSYSIPNVYFPDAVPIPGLGPNPRLSLVFKPNKEFTAAERQRYVVTKVQVSDKAKGLESYTETEKAVQAGAINKFLDEVTINYNQLMGLFIVGLRAYMMSSVMKDNLDKNRCKLPSFVELDPQSASIDAFKGAKPKGGVIDVSVGASPLSYASAVSASQRQASALTIAQVLSNLERIRSALREAGQNGENPTKAFSEMNGATGGPLRKDHIRTALAEAEAKGRNKQSEFDNLMKAFRTITPNLKAAFRKELLV